MDILLLFAQLFATFFVIGLFTFGGGYAMLSLIQTQVVTTHGWLTEGTFANIVAISQMTPGPIGINCATYTGYEVLASTGAGHVMGILGSLTATVGIVLPSFIIVLLLVRFYQKFHRNVLFEGVMSWLRPAVVGLIGAAAIILVLKVTWTGLPLISHAEVGVIEENFIDWKSWLLFGLALVVGLKFKPSPIWVIVAGGACGLLLY